MNRSLKRVALVSALVLGLVAVLAPTASASHGNLVFNCPNGQFAVDATETGHGEFQAPPNARQLLLGENTTSVLVIARVTRNWVVIEEKAGGLLERSNVNLVTCTLRTAAGTFFEVTGILTPAP